MFTKIVIGGTFNRIHKGHTSVLNTAFQIGRSVVIGLTSDKFASRFRIEKVFSYEERRGNLVKVIEKFKRPYEIIEIDDAYGIATIDPEIDCIVVSEETLLRAEEINAIRFKRGLGKLTIVVVPIVLAKDGKPISGDRISSGEIDSEGNLLKA